MYICTGRAFAGASLALFAIAAAPSVAMAQTRSLPTREQVELPRVAPPAPRSEVQVDDQTPRTTVCPFADSSLEVEITRLNFVGSGGASLPEEVLSTLRGISPPAEKHRLTALCDLRDAAAERLQRAGYIAGVNIPPQEIHSGAATFTVILGRISDVRLTGSPGRYRRTIEARIAQIKRMPVLNTREVERILMLANDVPGLHVNLSLRSAGTQPGELLGDLAVSYAPWQIVGNVQNSGSRQIGRENLSVRAEYYGLTGLSDRTFIGASSTADFEEQHVLQVGHYFSDDHGLTFGGRFSYAWSRPDLGALDLRSNSLIGGLEVYAPLARSVRSTATLGGGIEFIQQRIKLDVGSGQQLPVTEDKLRVGYLRLSASHRAPSLASQDLWAIGGSVELRKGFDVFGATDAGRLNAAGYAPSRIDGDPNATVIRGGVDGRLGIGRLAALSAQIQGQWANHALLSFEEFSVGNLTIGRGYDPGATSGDRAIGIHVEPSVWLPIRSTKVGAQAFAFYDVVRIWNLDHYTTENDRALRSLGAGVRVNLLGKAALEASYAHPLDSELRMAGAKRAPDRLLLSLTVQYTPTR